MTIRDNNSPRVSGKKLSPRSGERGAALATAILMMALLSAIAMTVLAVVHSETRVAGGDLKRTQTFYAAASGIEKMTSDFSALYGRTPRPTQSQLDAIALAYPSELVGEGFAFDNPPQTILPDNAALADMRTTQGIIAPALPRVTMPANSPFGGLIASVNPFILTSTATAPDGTQVALTRNMNNYLIPLFQFGMFSDEDLELHPGPAFTFNGRVHANGNIYVNGNVKFLDKVTTANEFIYDVLRNNSTRTGATVSMQVGSINVAITKGSMNNGPNIPGAAPGQRGYFPTSPNGTINSNWNSTSVSPAVSGVPNKFGGQLLTGSTGAAPLRLPMELDGNPTREIIKRRLPTDSLAPPAIPSALTDSRYHTKAEIRILIDDEGVNNDAAGLYGAQNGDGINNVGVNLSTFVPIPLPAGATSTAATGGGRALWRLFDAPLTTAATAVKQQTTGTSIYANTVRSAQTGPVVSATGTIPGGAGLSGHILIQIVNNNVDPAVVRDVTREILSMGMTEGEPNAIVQLQRPLWAAFTQGSRDATGATDNLVDIVNFIYGAADGELGGATQDATYGFLTGITDDITDFSGTQPIRSDLPVRLKVTLNDGSYPVPFTSASLLANLLNDWGRSNCGASPGPYDKDCWIFNRDWNAIVPINIYNVREGRISTTGTSPTASANAVYERGITNVVELNMKNLARWMDGLYDANLLANTPAISANIANADGYVVYVSDRRGDNVKAMAVPVPGIKPVIFQNINSTNGMVDNVDIYGPNNAMDEGEDVQNTGLAVGSGLVAAGLKDTNELPDPIVLLATSGGDVTARTKRAISVAVWPNSNNYFRRSVRLFNGEDLQTNQAANRLSTTLGITVASENMVYTWGNYNTTGINIAPPAGTSSLNDATTPYFYLPILPNDRQVPASIVCDAFFPLSKTWHDSASAMYPDVLAQRRADMNLPLTTPVSVLEETSVRAGIIAGNNLSAMAGNPDAGNAADGESRLNGGMHNFPRFLETWSGRRFNFVGSLIPLYRSTQAVGPYNANSTIYSPPTRNWAFDVTFTNPARLPPGTPQFQHIEPTGFRQIL